MLAGFMVTSMSDARCELGCHGLGHRGGKSDAASQHESLNPQGTAGTSCGDEVCG